MRNTVPTWWRALWAALLSLGLLAAAAAQRAPDSEWWSAIRRDDVSTVQGMLLRHTDPNALGPMGNPALTQSVREQSWRVFDVLLKAPGIQIDLPNTRDETALMYLAILGETERAGQLIQAGAQINRLGWTPLHYAASKARMETAAMLIQRGAIVNAPGPDGTTPLMMAAYSGRETMVRLLLSHGADPTMFNTARETAADWARKSNSTALAAKLDDAAARTAQARGGSQAAASEQPQAATPDPAQTQDESSFSRYFDLQRFEEDSKER